MGIFPFPCYLCKTVKIDSNDLGNWNISQANPFQGAAVTNQTCVPKVCCALQYLWCLNNGYRQQYKWWDSLNKIPSQQDEIGKNNHIYNKNSLNVLSERFQDSNLYWKIAYRKCVLQWFLVRSFYHFFSPLGIPLFFTVVLPLLENDVLTLFHKPFLPVFKIPIKYHNFVAGGI